MLALALGNSNNQVNRIFQDYAPANSDVNLRSDDLCTLYRGYARCSTT